MLDIHLILNLIPLTREYRPFTEDWNRLKSGIKNTLGVCL